MMKFASRLAMTAAAAGLAFAPIAAQANTRAGDSSTFYSGSAVSQPGVGRSADGEELKGTSGILIILFGAAVIAGIIIIIDDEDNQSPGAN
ncbi:hypothetical protein [uncultured Erythrobacter sp.]|uniref:hypothetical protein n=1 Tax=uncultured Erythrobacter sp. TaxID=263913 RepID=UPI00262F6C27|nr:hypothetical protein [uncultured Erythrobacter sp.]